MSVHTREDEAVVRRRPVIGWLIAAGMIGCLLYSYWPVLAGLWAEWQSNPDYSAGQLVPIVIAYFVWHNRRSLSQLALRPCWWGILLLVLSQAVRGLAAFLSYGSLEQLSFLLTVVGTVLTVAGSKVTRKLIWVFVFMGLLFPLPRRVHGIVALPLQDFATASAVYGLEMLGYLVVREGNVLHPGPGITVAIAEACSGLRMLTAFVMVAGALALMIRRPMWQKVVLVLSSVPVAVLTNTLRLIATVLLYNLASGEIADKFFHDLAGLTMMPFAVVVLVGELWLLKSLTTGTQTGAVRPNEDTSGFHGGRPVPQAVGK